MFVTVFPTVLGTDAAGEVTKVAPGVTTFKVGDRVIYQGQYNCQGDTSNGDKATFQQYGLADADLAAKVRRGWTCAGMAHDASRMLDPQHT